MASMLNIDRHIAISAGWVAGPAFGVAMMAAPEYLHLGPTTSGLLFWGGIVVFLATVTVVVWVSLYEGRKRKPVTSPIIVMTIGMLIFCGGVAWYFWPKTEAAPDPSALDGSIQISCENSAYPTVVPQNKMFELQLNNRFMSDGGAFVSWTFPAGTALPNRDPTIQPMNGHRCRISNYGKVAIINAAVTFPVDFRTADKMENGTRSGDVQKSAAVTTPPFSIGPGEHVDIYAMNYSTDTFAQLSIPPTAQGSTAGSDNQDTFRLIAPFLSGVIIPPFTPKSPAAPAASVPTPRGKQGKK
jgi:hypothetical protein